MNDASDRQPAGSTGNLSRRRFIAGAGLGTAALLAAQVAGGLPEAGAVAAAPATPDAAGANLPAVPLAVRTPYLSAWAPRGVLPGQWATRWDGQTIVGLAGLVRIDGHPWVWAGDPVIPGVTLPLLTQTGVEVTATRSVFSLEGGGIRLDVEWVSPIEPGDMRRQSVPFALLMVAAASLDGRPHRVQLYADISGEWVSGVPTDEITWSRFATGRSQGWEVQLQRQERYAERNSMAAWGQAVFATSAGDGRTTHRSAQDILARSEFVRSGALSNEDDRAFRAVNDLWPVFALAHDLGTVDAHRVDGAVYAIGNPREPSVRWLSGGLTPRWRVHWPSWNHLLDDFLADAGDARERAIGLDQRVVADALRAGGVDYAVLCNAALRQAYGACELVIGPQGQEWAMLKEISSDGDLSTLDVLTPTIPALLYLDPGYAMALLDPVFTYATSSEAWRQEFAPHALGIYPVATPDPDAGGEQMPVEEASGALILAAAIAARLPAATADAFLRRHAALWDQWAAFLSGSLPYTGGQRTSDDWTTIISDDTNLVLKGIIGLAAARQIADRIGEPILADVCATRVAVLRGQWLDLASDPSGLHMEQALGAVGTWEMLYNAYWDRLLGTGVVPADVTAAQAKWYGERLDRYGLPFSSSVHAATKADWELFVAAWLKGDPVSHEIVKRVARYVSTTESGGRPFPDLYDPRNGAWVNFEARPVVGAVFSLLTV